MKPSIDFLALALLVITALIAIFLRLRFSDDEAATTVAEEEVFYRQQKIDPVSMELPVTGLSEGAFFIEGNGYLPADINRLLLDDAKETGEKDDAAGLTAALSPAPKTSADKSMRLLTWAVTAFVILLGLIFLLLWMLTFIWQQNILP